MTDEELLIWLRVEDTNLTDFAANRIEELIEESGRRLALARSEGVARVEQFERTEALTEQRDKAWESLLHWRNKSFDLEEKLALMMFERDEAWKRAAHAEKMWGEAEVKLATCEKYRDAYVECDRIGTQAVRDLEAKLAKAVEALEDIVKDCEADYPPSHGAIKYFCRTTLAEIKGESHDPL